MLVKKEIKKIGFRGKKGSTNRGYDQPAQPVEEPINRLCSSDQGPVEGGQKFSLSPSSLLFPVEVILLPVEETVTCHALNAPTTSEPVDL